MGKIKDVNRWRVELELAEKHRDEKFGKSNIREKTLAGENIDYFEYGYSHNRVPISDEFVTTLNIIDAVVSVVVPSLYFRNPRTTVIPRKVESEDSSTIVGKTVDYYRETLEAECINKKIIWDAYVLGYGVYKVGYSTKFGMDLEDEDIEKNKKKSLTDKTLETLGLKKPKPVEEPERKELDARIISENPFIEYINPFDFLIDPRATSINDAMWVAQCVRKSVDGMKSNKKYKNTANLKGTPPEDRELTFNQLEASQMEDFHTVELFEIHYRNDGKWYLLTISKDGDEFHEHYHEESIYKLSEYQFDMLVFKEHGDVLYPRSDITKIKNLQDRITSTIDAILEQVDKFTPKLAYSSGDVTPNGMKNLKDGTIGALVECNKSPGEVFQQLNFSQLKTDLKALIDELITLISVQTGITRAQLIGVSDSRSATEATIEQGGQNLRTSDMAASVQKMVNGQSRRLWKVIRQFVTLEDLQLINGVRGIDEETGLPKYDWLTIDSPLAGKMQVGDYDFDIEVGSTQKADLSVSRKGFENLFNILARPDVIGLIQQQGSKVALAEMLRKYFDLFPELGVDSGKIIQNITQQTSGLVDPAALQGGAGGNTAGSDNNALEAQRADAVPTQGGEINSTF